MDTPGDALEHVAQLRPDQVRVWVQRHPANLMLYLGWEVEWFHREAFDRALASRASLWLAPRGSGKSTSIAVVLPAWLAIADPKHWLPTIPRPFASAPRPIGPWNVRVALTSNSYDKAASLHWQVKALLAGEKMARLFGPLEGKRWKDEVSETSQRTENLREGTFTPLGLGSKVTGGHYDFLVVDDWVTEDNARTALQRERLANFWKYTVRPTLEPWGAAAGCGTRYHPQDWYADLLVQPEWTVARTPAILDAGGDNPRSYWPAVYSLAKLQSIKDEIGPVAFAAQYQNEVDLMMGGFFRPEALEKFVHWEHRNADARKKARTVITVDPAIKGGARADCTGIVVASLVEGEVHFRHCLRGQWTKDEIKARVDMLRQRYPETYTIGVEVVAGTEWLVQDFQQLGWPVRPLRPRQFAGRSKEGRADQARSTFDTGRVAFEPPTLDNGLARLREELMAYQPGNDSPGVDDCADAGVWAIILLGMGRGGRVRLLRGRPF
jgi:hypothetical protein